MQIEFVSAPKPTEVEGVVATLTFEGEMSSTAQGFDEAAGGALTRAL